MTKWLMWKKEYYNNYFATSEPSNEDIFANERKDAFITRKISQIIAIEDRGGKN